ncbi:MAG: hypothetical protein RLZZ290_1645 [Pseudomonadota bacterium]
MIPREASSIICAALADFPAVALLGPRQVGKTTLALSVAAKVDPNFIYLDLESELDQAKLANPRTYLSQHRDRLVVIDEVHRKPALFPELRGLIDEAKRHGAGTGRYLLLGSASLDLLKQSGETLAGRIHYAELAGFTPAELPNNGLNALWLRGGFPESFLAATDDKSMQWRRSFIRSYLERDVGQFAPRISTPDLRRLWGMLAHQQCDQLNLAALSRSLGVDQKTVKHYVALLSELLLVRQLPAWHSNRGKRLVKTPKTYIRDSGLAHCLLEITSTDALLSHPVVGGSWEAFVVEAVNHRLGGFAQTHFYRTSAGAEIDLVIEWPNRDLWAIEIKRSVTPKLSKGFHHACEDIKPKRKIVITPGDDPWWLAADIEVISLSTLDQQLKALTPLL